MTTSIKARAWLAAILTTSSIALAHDADAFVVKKAPSGAVVHWATSDVTFTVSPTIDQTVSGAGDAFARAAAAWSRVTPNAPSINVARGEANDKPGYDGKNIVYYAKDGYAPAGNALAVTILTIDDKGAIVDCDIVLNGDRGFTVLPDDARAEPGAHAIPTEGGDEDCSGAGFDLVHVLAHEMGHALGLGDARDQTSALMYPYTIPGDASLRGPTGDDASGLAAIYATPAPSSSDAKPHAGGCSMAGSVPNPWWSALALAVALGAGTRRARRPRGDDAT